MFGSDPTEIPAAASQTWVTRWQDDPWSLGSYSYIRAGATGTERTVLAQPLSKLLYFAGEAANKKYASTVQVRFCNGVVGKVSKLQSSACPPPLESALTGCVHNTRAAHSRMRELLPSHMRRARCALTHARTRSLTDAQGAWLAGAAAATAAAKDNPL